MTIAVAKQRAASTDDREPTRTGAARDSVLDCAFLTVLTIASMVLYIGELGFYYDDYSLLMRMHLSDDRSLVGIYDAVRPALGQRPVAAALFALLYWLFGTEPLGYHLVNSGLLIPVVVLLYLVLRELRLPRLIAVALPLLYTMLPHYATDRFWMDLAGVNMSTGLYVLSLYASLRAVRAGAVTSFVWITIAVVAVGVMMFTYEIFAPLVLLNAGLVWWAGRTNATSSSRRRALWSAGSLLAVLLVTGVTKLVGVAEEGQNGYEIGLEKGVLYHVAYLVAGAAKVNFGTYFLALPYVVWWILRNELAIANVIVAGGIALATFAFLFRIGRREGAFLNLERTWRVLIGVGLIAFVLGYAIFLTTDAVAFRSAGIDNRVNVGAAMGVAAAAIGLIGWLASRFDERRAFLTFCAATAVAVGIGTLVVQTLGSFWTRAADRQEEILAAVKREAAMLPLPTTVILDGSCPEIGPAVVFADQFDFRGALRIEYGDGKVTADVASEDLRPSASGLMLETTIFDKRSRRSYPYGPRLIVFDLASRRSYRMPDRAHANAYVRRSRPSFRCPLQRSFAWGFDPYNRWSLQ